MRKIIRSLAISPIGILILRIKGGGVSVPMYHDREIYTQPRNFPFQNSPIEYKGMGRLRPYVPRQGNLYAALRFPLFEFVVLRITSGTSPSLCTTTGKIIRSLAIFPIGILLLRIKRRGISVPVYLDRENYTQP